VGISPHTRIGESAIYYPFPGIIPGYGSEHFPENPWPPGKWKIPWLAWFFNTKTQKGREPSTGFRKPKGLSPRPSHCQFQNLGDFFQGLPTGRCSPLTFPLGRKTSGNRQFCFSTIINPASRQFLTELGKNFAIFRQAARRAAFPPEGPFWSSLRKLILRKMIRSKTFDSPSVSAGEDFRRASAQAPRRTANPPRVSG